MDDANEGLDAGDDGHRLDELVERDVVAEPSSVATDLEEAVDLTADAGDELGEVAIELGVVGGGAVQRLCGPCRSLVDR